MQTRGRYEKPHAFEDYKKYILNLNNLAESEVEKIKISYYKKHNNEFNLICGKFLLESLYCHIRNITGINFRKDDFRWHLICDFDIRKLGYVKERILVAMDV